MTLHKLFQTEMTRKQFLATIGALFLLLTGITGLTKQLGQLGFTTAPQKNKLKMSSVQRPSGYGYGPYGV